MFLCGSRTLVNLSVFVVFRSGRQTVVHESRVLWHDFGSLGSPRSVLFVSVPRETSLSRALWQWQKQTSATLLHRPRSPCVSDDKNSEYVVCFSMFTCCIVLVRLFFHFYCFKGEVRHVVCTFVRGPVAGEVDPRGGTTADHEHGGGAQRLVHLKTAQLGAADPGVLQRRDGRGGWGNGIDSLGGRKAEKLENDFSPCCFVVDCEVCACACLCVLRVCLSCRWPQESVGNGGHHWHRTALKMQGSFAERTSGVVVVALAAAVARALSDAPFCLSLLFVFTLSDLCA